MITIKTISFMIYQIFCQNVIHQRLGILRRFARSFLVHIYKDTQVPEAH